MLAVVDILSYLEHGRVVVFVLSITIITSMPGLLHAW